jgi:hypothetical protein
MNTTNTRGTGNGSTTGRFSKPLTDEQRAERTAAQLAAIAKRNIELGIDTAPDSE